MELRRLRLLHELSRHDTIAAVATALNYSPSSVSVQLTELEREAGVQLLRRAGRNVHLTEAGLRLAAHAEHALAADEAVRAELAALDRAGAAPRGRVRMSVVQTAALALLPTVLAGLAESAPDLRIEVRHGETVPALQDLRSRAVDLVVGIEYPPVPPPRHRDVDRRDLLHEDVLLALPADAPLAGLEHVDIADVAHHPWAAGPPGSGHALMIEYLCNRLGGYAPDIRHRTDDALVLRALVSSGRAVTLLPALIGTATPLVTVRPVTGTRLERTIFTATRTAAASAPSITAVRDALRRAAGTATTGRADARPAASIPEGPRPPPTPRSTPRTPLP